MTEDELIDELRRQVEAGYRFYSRKPTASLPAPATDEAVLEAEAVLKAPLPTVLRRTYLEVANGGFGPGFGILGVGGGWTDDLGRNLVDLARKRTRYRRTRVYFCYLGGAMYHHCDVTTDGAPVSMWTEGDHVSISPSVHQFFETDVLALEEYHAALRCAIAISEVDGYDILGSEWINKPMSCESTDLGSGPYYRCDVTVVVHEVEWDAPPVLEVKAVLVEGPDGEYEAPIHASVHIREDGVILEP